jgi:hypothetical protein
MKPSPSPLRLAVQIVVVARMRPDVGFKGGNHPHRGHLASAIGTEEAMDLARLDVEADTINGFERRRSLRVLHRDHLLVSGPSTSLAP